MSVPFVGRRAEIDLIALLIERALRDRAPAAALVSGDPGCGKSRLLGELLRRAPAARTIMLVGFEPMQSVPLGASVDLLRLLVRTPDVGRVLAELVFGQGHADDRDPLRIFEAAYRALSASGPLIMAIDDLQWLDDRSLALLQYLLRSSASERRPLAVIAAARPSPSAAAFRASLEVELPGARRTAIDLGPLTLEDGRLLARTIDASLDEAAATELWQRAMGSPFWLEALAQGRAKTDRSQLIAERLAALSGDGGALLAGLAIGARPFSVEEIAGVLEWDVGRVGYAAHELVSRGLGLEALGTLRAAHDLIRESATTTLPAATRRRLHARFADWIEATAGDDLPTLREALEHRIAADLPAAPLALRLLSSPQRRLIDSDGLRMIAAIGDGLAPGSADQLELDRHLGQLGAALGDQALALDRWTRVATAADRPADRQHAAIEAARAAYRMRRPQAAHALLDRAAAEPLMAGDVDGAELAVARGSLRAEIQLWLDHETPAGSVTARRALADARRLIADTGGLDRLSPTARRATLAAYDAAIDAALQQDRATEVVRLTEASVGIAAGVDPESHLASLMRQAFGLGPLGRAREAEARYRQAWQLAEEQILPTIMVEAGHGLGRVLRTLGRLEEARAVAARTLELERRLGHPPRRWGNTPSILHLTELALGDVSRIRDLQEDARSEPDPHYRLAVHQVIAVWLARLHGARFAGQVTMELAAAHAAATEAGCPRCARELSVVSAEALARVGHVDDAREALADWEGQARSEYLMRRVWRNRARAAIAHASGDDQSAIEVLEESAREIRGEALLEDLIWTLLDLGAAFVAVDRARAVSAYTEAATLAERTGAVTQGRQAAKALRRLGIRAWRRGRAGVGAGIGALSGREQEVARLVAQGNSNHEIAETLVVAPKTVERHVTNVLAKLGLRNRTELAALVRSESGTGFPR